MFKDQARVVFLGDSITCNGLYIAKIFDYYKEHYPERRVKLYNFGVPGDTARGCLAMNRHRLMLDLFAPTEVVLMFGMNDVGYNRYTQENRFSPEMRESALRCKQIHLENMRTLAAEIASFGLPITLCSVTPYDEISDGESPRGIGCNGALRDLFARNQIALAPYVKDVIDFGGPMNDLITEIYVKGGAPIIGPDRVHPSAVAHNVMARLFLRAQGALDVAAPTAESIMDGTVSLPELSEAGALRKKAEEDYRALSYIDFNVRWGQESMKTVEEKVAYWKNRLETDLLGSTEYRARSAANYVANKANEEEFYNLLMERTDNMY